MNLIRAFPCQVVAAFLLLTAISAYPVLRWGSVEIAVAAAAGGLLGLGNVLLGYLTVEYAFEKSYTAFLKAVLGGMGARMLVLLGALLVLVMVLHLHRAALVISLVVYYSVFLVLEILYIQKKVLAKGRQ